MSDRRWHQQRVNASKNNEHPLDVRDDELSPHDDENDHDPEQVAFYVYGMDASEIDHAWNTREGEPSSSYDHEAHEAATIVMDALQERFDWASEITGVAMGVRENNE